MKVFRKETLLALVGTLILFLSFQFNTFQAVEQKWFNNFQRDSERIVLNGIMESRQHSYFSHAGKLGWETNTPHTSTYQNYLTNTFPTKVFVPYAGSFGIQRLIYSIIDSSLETIGIRDGQTKYTILTSLTALSTAAVIVILSLFIYKYFGLISSLTLIGFSAFSDWLIVIARNLYWMPVLILLPFVLSTYLLMQDEKRNTTQSPHKMGLLIFIAIYIKCLAGYEYISSVLIAAMVPFIFFAIKNQWKFNFFLKRFLLVSCYGVMGFLVAAVTHIIQSTITYKSFDKAYDLFIFNILKRTHADVSQFASTAYYNSLNANTYDVVVRYINAYNFELIIIALAVASILNTFLVQKHSKKTSYVPLNTATLVMLWVSILAPLSWFILAKGHSYIHVHINYVLWYVPFLLIGFAYFGFTINNFFHFFLQSNQKALITLTLILISVSVLVKQQREKNHFLSQINDIAILKEPTIRLGIRNNYLIYTSTICANNLHTRFFLHFIPVDASNLPTAAQTHGFANGDFNWKEKELFTSIPLLNDTCIAQIPLPNYPLAAIKTGQFNQSGRLWESYINLNANKQPPVSEFSAFNLSNTTWRHGIHLGRPLFFIENTFANRQSIKKGDLITFPASGERKVIDLSYSNRYINITVDGDKLIPEKDGYPHKILKRN